MSPPEWRGLGLVCLPPPTQIPAIIPPLNSTRLISIMFRSVKILGLSWSLLVTVNLLGPPSSAQTVTDETHPVTSSVESLGLSKEQALQLQRAMDAQDYIPAEKLLLAEIDHDPHSPRTARLLKFVGSDRFRQATAFRQGYSLARPSPAAIAMLEKIRGRRSA